MKCASGGMLRSYLDGQLATQVMAELRTHIADCTRCATEVGAMTATSDNVRALLRSEMRMPDSTASLRLTRQRIGASDSGGSWRNAISALQQPGWAWLGTVAVILAVAVAMSPVRIAAEGLLGIFRVQSFAAVIVDTDQMPSLSGVSGIFDPEMMTDPKLRETADVVASPAVDFPVKLPQYLPSSVGQSSKSFVSEAAEASYTVDLKAAREALARAGMKDVQLPASLDGATLHVRVPPAVVTIFGVAAEGTPAAPKESSGTRMTYLLVAQSRGPTLEVPETVDVAALREQVLAMPLIPPDVAKQLRAIKDWRHTLVIPVKSGTHVDVLVGGAPGLLIAHPSGDNTLLWQRNGVIYGLMGNLGETELMRVANSLR